MKLKPLQRPFVFLSICVLIFIQSPITENLKAASISTDSSPIKPYQSVSGQNTNSSDPKTSTYLMLKSIAGQSIVKNKIILMPDAASKNSKIIFHSVVEESAIVNVIDEEGKKLLTQNVQLTIGKNNIVINDFKNLKEGKYDLQLICEHKTYTSKCIIWQ